MYELDAIKEALQQTVKLRERAEQIESPEHRAKLKADHGDSWYAAMTGELLGTIRSDTWSATYQLRQGGSMETLARSVALLERMAEVMHNEFDVSAYEDSKELRMLELLATDDYKSERRELQSTLNRILGDVADKQRHKRAQVTDDGPSAAVEMFEETVVLSRNNAVQDGLVCNEFASVQLSGWQYAYGG